MKVIILAGGLGTRLSSDKSDQPKPIVEIGGKPILWHIMNIYAAYNITEFVIALGYKGNIIKEYFNNINFKKKSSYNEETFTIITQHDWTIHLVNTGLDTMTGGRIKRLKDWIKNDDVFLLTYGDGIANIDVKKLIGFHKSHNKLATITAVNPPERFGKLKFDGIKVTEFNEKPKITNSWINGGFFVLNPKVMEYIEGDNTVWEHEPINRLVQDNQLMGYKHRGFWYCMDTPGEKQYLEDLWVTGEAPWKIW